MGPQARAYEIPAIFYGGAVAKNRSWYVVTDYGPAEVRPNQPLGNGWFFVRCVPIPVGEVSRKPSFKVELKGALTVGRAPLKVMGLMRLYRHPDQP